jgi:hypothetical protein
MNFVFNSKSKKPGPALGCLVLVVGCAVLVVVALGVVMFSRGAQEEALEPVVVAEDGVVSDSWVIRSVSDSFGVPYGKAVRLSEFLGEGDFPGIGLFKVKPVHLDMLQNRFVPGAVADLEDPVMNANIALGLLSSFHDRGYSWEQSFLIYVYGWGDLAPVTRSVEAQEFLDFVFGGDSDG